MPVPNVTPSFAVIRGGETLQFTSPNTPATWYADRGSINPAGLYTPKNFSGYDTIIATSTVDGLQNEIEVLIEAQVLLKPSADTSGETRKRIDVSESGGKARQTRRRSGSLRYIKFSSTSRTKAETDDFLKWHRYHHPDRIVWWDEPLLGDPMKLYIDSNKAGINQKSRDVFDIDFDLREVSHQRVPLIMPDSEFPYRPDYQFEEEQERVGFQFDSIGDGTRVGFGLYRDLNTEPHEFAIKRWKLSFTDRDPSELLLAEAYWDYYYSGVPFWVRDWTRNISHKVEFDSNFSWGLDKGHRCHYSFAIVETRKPLDDPPPAPVDNPAIFQDLSGGDEIVGPGGLP